MKPYAWVKALAVIAGGVYVFDVMLCIVFATVILQQTVAERWRGASLVSGTAILGSIAFVSGLARHDLILIAIGVICLGGGTAGAWRLGQRLASNP